MTGAEYGKEELGNEVSNVMEYWTMETLQTTQGVLDFTEKDGKPLKGWGQRSELI